MKDVHTIAAQGDVLFRIIDKLPADVIETKRDKGPLVVAHSETGHHHSIETQGVRLYEKATRDPLICYLAIEGLEPAEVLPVPSTVMLLIDWTGPQPR